MGCRCRGVDKALELNTLLVQFSDQINEVLDPTAKAIQLPNNQSAAFPRSLKEGKALHFRICEKFQRKYTVALEFGGR